MPRHRRDRRSSHRGPSRRPHLGIESLEGRIVFAADIGFDSASGVLSINGSEGDDAVEVRQQDMNFVVSDVAVTENQVLAGTVPADMAVGDFVVDEVPPSLTNPVNLGCTIFRPVLYVYNETPADGSYGGVASALIEISSAVCDESGELVAGPVWEDRLTGSQYLLPTEMTLVSKRDLTGLLQYCGIGEYRAEDQGRWVIPVSPDEGIGFLNRAMSLTFYSGYLAGQTPTEVFSSTDFSVEVVLATADPAIGRDMKLVLPDTRIGIYYETVTIGSDDNDQPFGEEGEHVADGGAGDGSDMLDGQGSSGQLEGGGGIDQEMDAQDPFADGDADADGYDDEADNPGSSDYDAPSVGYEGGLADSYRDGGDVTFTLRGIDETGVAGIGVFVLGPNGRLVDDQTVGWIDASDTSLTSGNPQDGIYTVRIKLAATAIPGDYKFLLGYADTIGNRAWNEASYSGYPSINVVVAADNGVDSASGVLSINGSEGDDAVEVRQQDMNLVVSLISASGQLSPTMSSATLSQIAFSAAVSNDTLTNLTVMPVRRRR